MAAAVGVLDLNNPRSIPWASSLPWATTTRSRKTISGPVLQGDFSFDLGGRTLRGNVGVRYVQTDLTSEGYTFTRACRSCRPVTHEYSDTLPSLNLVYDFSDEFLVRFAASKVMTRPNLGNLNPGAAVSVSGNNRTVTAGNP